MKAVRLGLTAVVIVVLGVAIAGIGMGDAPSRFPAPTGAALTASKARIKAGDASVQNGKREFTAHGCDDCHALAAIGADGKLGPRMDAQPDPVERTVDHIVNPPRDIPGFTKNLMPRDYVKRIGPADIKDIAAFIKAASGDERPGGPGGGPPPGGGSGGPPPQAGGEPPDDDG